jgi:hypothetical protein
MRLRLDNVGRAARQGGATLVEVLVAIFVMAIGMITLLTLFPLGLLSMAQAIKDDRTALAAASAAAIERIWDIRHAGNQPLGQPAACIPPAGAFWTTIGATAGFFSNPATNPNAPVGLPAISTGAGYPIYVDPFAFSGAAGSGSVNPTYGTSVGGQMQRVDIGVNQHSITGASNPGTIAVTSTLHGLTNGSLVFVSGVGGNTAANGRFTITVIDANTFSLNGSSGSGAYTGGGVWQYAFPDQATAWRTSWLTLLDDIEFENNGVPSPGDPNAPPTATIFRDDRYTWAYLLRMGDVLNPSVVNLTIVVYSGRTQLSGEKTYAASWSAAGNVVTLNFAGLDKPAIRKGGWILDNTVVVGTTANPNGYFYRVVNVADGVSGANTVDLEVQPTRRGVTQGGTDPGLGSVVVMEGVVEVFERGPSAP